MSAFNLGAAFIGLICCAALASPARAQEENALGPVGQCGMVDDPAKAISRLQKDVALIDSQSDAPEGDADILAARKILILSILARNERWIAEWAKFKAADHAATEAAALAGALTTVSGNVAAEGRAAHAELSRESGVAAATAAEARRQAAASACAEYTKLSQYLAVVENLPDIPNRSPQRDAAVDPLGDCIRGIGDPEIELDFSHCLLARKADGTAADGTKVGADAQMTNIALPDRPLQPRGFTAAFTGSKSATELSLKFANEYKLRLPDGDGQQYRTWGYSLGLATDTKSLLDLDKDGDRNDEEFESGYDRIAASTKLTGGLSFNVYPFEPESNWSRRAQKVFDDARQACLKDAAAKGSTRICLGSDLHDWLVQYDPGSGFKHAKEMAQYSDLYFGVPKSTRNAQYGMLLDFELSRPNFEFKIAGVESDERHWDWSLRSSFYRNVPLGGGFDLTGVYSLAYKRDWRDYFASTKALDKTQQPVEEEGFVPAIEARLFYEGSRRFPPVAFLPKLSFDTTSDRDSLAVPLLFFFGEKLGASAGFRYDRAWGGNYDDGPQLPTTDTLSLIFQSTFSLNPE